MAPGRGRQPLRALGKTLCRGCGSRVGRDLRDRLTRLALTLPTLTATLAGSLHAQAPAAGELRSGNLVFVYWRGKERAARALATATNPAPALPGIPGAVLEHGTPITVYLPPDHATFEALAPEAPDWSGAITFPDRDRIVLPIVASSPDQPPLRTILVHELAHVALRRYLGPGVPRWFHEGYAQLASGSWSGSQAWELRFAILAGRIPSLDSVDLDFSRQRVSAEHAYLLAYTAVDEMYRMGGPGGFEYLLERWHDGGDLDRAVRETYGITLHRFERVWRDHVRERYGWLLMLTQVTAFWAVLTAVLLILGYWKIRRNRRKLAELKAREISGPPAATAGPGGDGEDVD